MTTSITSTEVVRHMGDVLARVKHKGEHFVVTRNHHPIAEIVPASGSRRATWRKLREAVADLPLDPSFADDLDKVNAADRIAESPWG